MAHEVVMPQLGLSMDSGLIVEWLKQPGELVKPGDLLLVVESDKSAVEVEAVETGRLQITCRAEDGPIPVGAVIAYLLEEGEAPMGAPAAAAAAELPASAPEGSRTVGQRQSASGYAQNERPPSSPAARRRAAELGLDWRSAVPSGLRGQIKERDILALAARTEDAAAPSLPSVASGDDFAFTPVARRMAEAYGLDLGELARRNPGKRLDRLDIEDAVRMAVRSSAPTQLPSAAPADGAAGGPTPAQPPSAAPADRAAGGPTPAQPPFAAPADGADSHRRPAGSLRKIIAERMAYSAHTTAPVTLTTTADATELVKMRLALKNDAQAQVVPSYNVLIAALAAKALREHPVLNATLEDGEIIYWNAVHIGIAVDTPRGLVVPVLRNVAEKSFQDLAREAEDLLDRAAAGKSLPDELTGSTFTLTNLGVYRIDAFTPIINLPNCAVLGVGRFNQQPVVIADQVVIRTMVALSLTFDHRLVDGAPAARFLDRIHQFVEQPYLWLMR